MEAKIKKSVETKTDDNTSLTREKLINSLGKTSKTELVQEMAGQHKMMDSSQSLGTDFFGSMDTNQDGDVDLNEWLTVADTFKVAYKTSPTTWGLTYADEAWTAEYAPCIFYALDTDIPYLKWNRQEVDKITVKIFLETNPKAMACFNSYSQCFGKTCPKL